MLNFTRSQIEMAESQLSCGDVRIHCSASEEWERLKKSLGIVQELTSETERVILLLLQDWLKLHGDADQ